MAKTDQARARDVLLVALAFAAGATDATAFERLGHVFASVITGNLIVLGISAASHDGTLALFAGSALAGYVLGVLVAAPRGPEQEGVWPRGTTLALLADLALLVVFAVGWELAGSHPSYGVQAVLVLAAGGAMGIQSTAVRRLGEMSTTYLTSTLTGLVESLRARRWSSGHARSLGILAMAVVGAAAATLVIVHARRWLPILQLLPLAGVLIAARRMFH